MAGDTISIADFCVLPTIVRMSDIGLGKVWADLPHFKDWNERIRARPSFEEAFYPGAHVSLSTEASG